ncbi:anti-sigma factor domain-containing protein [Caldalkalibacillus salinus]|uniref:anti-sigma factor domain-containing protein n=1 Tax=Caldalkalibacillus salinus TaxID=2803787 RepID=UPI0019244B56|nr:anti-sigma factor [Caldalkalibacillus salinus]
MTCKHGLTDEVMIDDIQGRLDAHQRQEVQEHLSHCDTCQQAYIAWAETLDHAEIEARPTPNLKRRVMSRVSRDTSKRLHFMQPKILAFLSSVAVLLLIVSIQFKPATNQNQTPTESHAEKTLLSHMQQTEAPFMLEEDTEVYVIVPDIQNNMTGYAWINEQSNEMMLLVDGLPTITINDYQAWIKTTNDVKNAGLFQVNGEVGQLYIQDATINRLEHIMVSREPRGGSYFPTDPDPVLIRLGTK